MAKENISWYARRVFLGLSLGFALVLSACSGIPVGGNSGNATPTTAPTGAASTPAAQPTSVPTIQPTLPALPTATSINVNPSLNVNLIANGDAEAGPGTTNEETIEPIPGWTRQGSIDVIQYASQSGGFIAISDPGPSDRGKNYFFGGGEDIGNFGDNTTTSVTQTIDLSLISTILSQGGIQFTLSAWLGGYFDQDDNAKLTIQFVSATGQVLGTASVGPVLAAAHNNMNGLIQRSTTGKVPAGVAKVLVTLTMTKTSGADNDASADDLSLVFHP